MSIQSLRWPYLVKIRYAKFQGSLCGIVTCHFRTAPKVWIYVTKKNAPKSFSRKNTQMDDLILALSTRALQVYSLTARLMRSGSDINKSSPATYKHFIPWVPHEIKNKNFKITKITWHSSSVVNFFECSQSSLSKGCSMETSGYSSGQMEEEISKFIFLTVYEPYRCKKN